MDQTKAKRCTYTSSRSIIPTKMYVVEGSSGDRRRHRHTTRDSRNASSGNISSWRRQVGGHESGKMKIRSQSKALRWTTRTIVGGAVTFNRLLPVFGQANTNKLSTCQLILQESILIQLAGNALSSPLGGGESPRPDPLETPLSLWALCFPS